MKKCCEIVSYYNTLRAYAKHGHWSISTEDIPFHNEPAHVVQ